MITAESERDKYERMWAVKDYRNNSPGEELVAYFLKNITYATGDTLIDLGCGTGRAGLKLSQAGFAVALLDHCESALDEKVKAADMPFIEANLWELPEMSPFHWFYCTDVLEHIPPEHVAQVLHNCAMVARRGFFQIAMVDDGFGKRIGEKLHLTIKNELWWMAVLKEHFHVEQSCVLSYKRLVAFVRSL